MSRRIAQYVPFIIRRQLDRLSKSDLMEVVWDYALFSVGDSAEDETYNQIRVEDILERLHNIRSSR